jgi:small subunit ribosomal protein S1
LFLPLLAALSATETLTPPAPAGTPVEGSGGLLLEIDGKVVPNYAATMVAFDEGDVVNGRVVRIDKDEVLVDIGYKSEGVIPSNELSIRKSVDPSDEVELGEEVDALVLTKEDAEGRLVLSKKRARFEKAWRKIEAAAESGEPVEGNVIEVVKGGLILDLGVRGFLPASLVDIRRVHNLDEFMGQTLECKVIELNRSRNNVVLSRRAVLEEERKEVREQILDRLQPGQIVDGKISNIVDFGAFVDLDGIDGLIHISELSWSHVNHPSEVVAIGDTVRIKVLDIDRDRQRISLGLKQTQEDPWQRVISTHRPGDVLEGTVTKVVAFGAFVEILPGVEGLVHISELADHHVESPSEVVEPGSTLNVKILEIDEERRRLSLSIKRVEGQNMPMQDLGAQIAEASGDATDADASAVGDVDSEGSAGGDSVSVLDPSEPTPPTDEAPEVDEPQDEAPEEQPEALAEDAAAEQDEAAEEESEAAEEAPADGDEPAPEASAES